MADLPVLMVLRVQGLTDASRTATALGTPERDAAERLAALSAAGLAKERTGRVSGCALTEAGTEALERALEDEGLRDDQPLRDAYDRFLLLNERVLRVSSRWQVRDDGAGQVPNDHTDAVYDQRVLDELFEIHGRAATNVATMADRAPRLAPYGDRLNACVGRLEAGDVSAFTAPMAESYHTVWFELHQDLLLTLGLERE